MFSERGFNNSGNEYQILDYETKMPYVNYFWNDKFISGVSQHMAGIGCFTNRPMQYMDPDCRCLMIKNENRHFYLKDNETNEFFSPGWYPVLEPLDKYSCIHGIGYSKLYAEKNNIEIQMRVFVPKEEPIEIWTIEIKNKKDRSVDVSLFSFVEWLLTGYEEYCDYYSALYSEFHEDKNLLIAFNKSPERTHDFFNGFIASDLKISGFDSSKQKFIGYSQINAPKVLLEGNCLNSIAVTEDMVGVLEHRIYLNKKESKTINIIIGATDTVDTANSYISKYNDIYKIDKSFEETVSEIENSYRRVTFSIPDDRLQALFNHWIKRSVALHTEVGTDTGKGLRDILQASWALASYDKKGSREKIIQCLLHQYKDGHTLRGWNPDDTHYYSDGPLWIPLAIDAYIKETGDFEFLKEKVNYYLNGEDSVLKHMLKGVKHLVNDLGEHGLVKIHYGDWNDSLNMMGNRGIGESVFTTIGAIYAIEKTIDILDHLENYSNEIEELKLHKNELTEAVNSKGWDGKWYLQGYNDLLEKVGSHEEEEGSVYLNSQTWAIIAGIVPKDRIDSVLDVIDNKLESKYGSFVLTPAYTRPNRSIGRLTWFYKGMWENASPYCHGTAFKIMADYMLKRDMEGFSSLMKVLPDSEINPSTHSGCPPYMVTNMYFGEEHNREGEILYSWVTGTADWLFKIMSERIIGVRATYKGLLIDPCAPKEWKKFGIIREYRDAIYDITFENKNENNKIKYIFVDGEKYNEYTLPIFGDGKKHEILVML